MEKLKPTCRLLGRCLVLLFVVFIYIGLLFFCAFVTYDCYAALRYIAPAICEIPNPVPPEIEIIRVDETPLGIKKEEKDPKLFFYAKTILAQFYHDKIVFYKSNNIAGEVVFYSWPFDPGGRTFFRSIKKVDIKEDTIRVQYKWEIGDSLFAIVVVFALCFFAVKYAIKSLEETYRWTFKKPKAKIS